MENANARENRFQRNMKLESLLHELNTLLHPAETGLTKVKSTPEFPVILLVGCPRSGTTLLMQWLAQTGYFAYPSNLLARFYNAPYIGARIQQMLTDKAYDFRNEFNDFNSTIDFLSDAGKTRGLLSPNEFWYFWRRFFHFNDIQYLTEEELSTVDSATFVSEIALLEKAFEKPVAMKGLIVNWNIPYISQILKNILFLNVTREPLYTAQSLLKTREKFYLDRKTWYSFKPREYEKIKGYAPCDQVAAQVFYTQKAVNEGLADIPSGNRLTVSYEAFCNDPKKIFNQLAKKINTLGFEKEFSYTGPETFQLQNRIQLSEEDITRIKDAYNKLANGVVIQ